MPLLTVLYRVPIPVYTCEDDSAPPGYAHHASGTLFTSIRTYSKLLQAVMRRDTKLLSKRTWELALADQLKDRGIKVPRPRVCVHRSIIIPRVGITADSLVHSGKPVPRVSPMSKSAFKYK